MSINDNESVMYKVEMSPSNMSDATNMQRLEYNGNDGASDYLSSH
jgi:hypothetical protein